MQEGVKIIIVFLFIFAGSGILLAQESQTYYDEALAEYQKGNYDQSILYAEMGIKFRDELIFSHYSLKGYCLLQLKKFEEAKEVLGVACKIDEKNPNYDWVMQQSQWLLGRIYGKKSDFKKEIQAYKKALKHGEDGLLYNNLGFVYVKLDSLELGLKYLTKSLKLSENKAFAYNNRAWLLIKLKKFKRAKIDLDKSREFDERNPYLYRNYGLYYLSIEDLDNACLSFKKAEKFRYRDLADDDEKDDVQNLIQEHCLELGIKQ